MITIGELRWTLPIAPRNFAERLDSIWSQSLNDAAIALRALVTETVALIEHHMPQIDTAAVHKALDRDDPPWTTSSDKPSA